MEEQEILEFTSAINQVVENNRKKSTSILVNNNEFKVKRKDNSYFLENFGWTSAYGLYHELSKEQWVITLTIKAWKTEKSYLMI